MTIYRVRSRCEISGHEATHPVGGYFGKPIAQTTVDQARSEIVANDVRRELGKGFTVWVEESEQ